MDYPVPTKKELFYFEKKIEKEQKLEKGFSRDKKNQFMDKFIEKIDRHGKLYQSLPFIQEIFLCNSISFNALKLDSDIDLFIIAKKNSIRRARLFSAIFFKLLGIKRSMKNKKQKFCLSFYITQDYKNLYSIMLEKTDIYLAYRIAHLVPLYQESKDIESIYIKNKRFKELLPNHPEEYCINIGNKYFTGKTKTKRILEFIFSGICGQLIEFIIKIIRIPILTKKITKLGSAGKNIVINKNMLKFHNDIREKIHLLYKIGQKS